MPTMDRIEQVANRGGLLQVIHEKVGSLRECSMRVWRA